MSTFRVLIVDDEASICELLELAFGRIDAEVITADSAEEGLQRFREGKKFDAALVDKNLPNMSGLDFMRTVRESDQTIALLMITGFYSAETATEALNIDVDAYIEKPFKHLATLVDRTTEAAAKRRARKPRPRSGPPRVVALADASVRSVLALQVQSPTVFQSAGTEAELLRHLAQPADVLVIDAAVAPDRVPAIVEAALAASPGAEVVVISSQQLGLGAVERLIELGVRRLMHHSSYVRHVLDAIAKTRMTN